MVTTSITFATSLSWSKINHRLLKNLFRLKSPRTWRGLINRSNLIAELEADPLFADNASSRMAARVKKPSRSFDSGRSIFQNGVTPVPSVPASPGAAFPRLSSFKALRGVNAPDVIPRGADFYQDESLSYDFIRRINISAFEDCKKE